VPHYLVGTGNRNSFISPKRGGKLTSLLPWCTLEAGSAGFEWIATPKTAFAHVLWPGIIFGRNFLPRHYKCHEFRPRSSVMAGLAPPITNNRGDSAGKPFDWLLTFWKHPRYGAFAVLHSVFLPKLVPRGFVAGRRTLRMPTSACLYMGFRYVFAFDVRHSASRALPQLRKRWDKNAHFNCRGSLIRNKSQTLFRHERSFFAWAFHSCLLFSSNMAVRGRRRLVMIPELEASFHNDGKLGISAILKRLLLQPTRPVKPDRWGGPLDRLGAKRTIPVGSRGSRNWLFAVQCIDGTRWGYWALAARGRLGVRIHWRGLSCGARIPGRA